MRIAMTFSLTPSKIVMDMDRIQAILEAIRKGDKEQALARLKIDILDT